jgi:shikimate dehydrogenase
MTDQYAVMGNPVAHSKSPLIHRRFAEQTGQDMDYRTVLVARDGFARAVQEFQAQGGRGLNVTVPFKQEAWQLADQRSPRAERAGAVNTLVLRSDGQRFGENTDGLGLVRDLRRNHGADLAGWRVLVLGAGGAVRGVLEPLLAEGPAEVVIVNRTAVKATVLAEDFSTLGRVYGGGYGILDGARFDLVINGTAASLQGQVPPVPASALARGAWCYDMMYGDAPTPFLQWAAGHGASKLIDGLGMLVEQAAESFHLWRGVWPDTLPVLAELRTLKPR